ncbi:hypothetical protein CCACVL1_12619 [Corchorus capsularis]|uniref:Uncharacterized protein n=1 Tax=Corchorus capsularis TaxID=210143 RepID=A0A1R3IEQ5_COCAP|nr:hypothetical protein CCACVL1_12619 [Corchorus capsularis]
MVCCCSQNLRDGIQACVRDYDRLQHIAVVLIYIQIGCALIGSLGALYNGVLLINLAIALFALVAIESSSQSLGRTYAVLLFFAILLDVSWFIFFSHDIWSISSSEKESHGILFIISVQLTLAMEILGFCVRLCSSFLWIQIYRLGVSYVDSVGGPRDADFDLRNSFLSPATPSSALLRQCSNNESDDALGGAIYDPAYYSSLFEDRQQQNRNSFLGHNDGISGNVSPSGGASPQLKPSPVRPLEAIDYSELLSGIGSLDLRDISIQK